MKKVITILLVALVLTSVGISSFAEKPSTPFDPKVLSSLSNYEEDKFDGTFYYYEAYHERYNDGKLIIGMDLENFEDALDVIVASLYVKIIDRDGDILLTTESIDFLVDDDTRYSYKEMMEMDASSVVLFDKDTRPLIEALSTAEKVSIRIGTDRGTATIDLDDSFETTLKEYCKNILKYNVLDYLVYEDDSVYASLISYFPLTIKK